MIDLSFSLTDLELFLLIVVRTTCFVYAAPFFGMNNTPGRVKVGLGVFIAILIYRIIPPVTLEYSTVFGFAVIVLKEAFTGVIIGFSAAIVVSILSFAGHIVDMNVGLSMVSMFDPVTRDNVTISGSYYQYTVMLMLLISGMYQYVLSAFVEGFRLIPVNGAVFEDNNGAGIVNDPCDS